MTNAQTTLLIRNGLIAVLWGLAGGFILVWSMLRGISLSPLPYFFDIRIPGSAAGWRSFHLGMLLNGLMSILLGIVFHWLDVPAAKAIRAAWAIVIAVWGNCAFYIFSMFAPNHGLTLESNHFGEASVAGAIAFLPALIGSVTLFYAIFVLVTSPFKRLV